MQGRLSKTACTQITLRVMQYSDSVSRVGQLVSFVALMFGLSGCASNHMSEEYGTPVAASTPSIALVNEVRSRLNERNEDKWISARDIGVDSYTNVRMPSLLLKTELVRWSGLFALLGDSLVSPSEFRGLALASAQTVNSDDFYVALNNSSATKNAESFSVVVASNRRGVEWKKIFEKNSVAIASVNFLNTDHGWIVGRKWMEEPGDRQYAAFVTMDHGMTWRDLSLDLNQIVLDNHEYVDDELTDVMIDEQSTVTVLSLRGRIFRTSDGGQTWRKVIALPFEDFQTCLCQIGNLAGGDIWIAGGADSVEGEWGVFAIVGSDKVWTRSRLFGVSFKHVKVISDQAIFAAAVRRGVNGRQSNLILFSSDRGATWSIVHEKSHINGGFWYLASASEDKVIVANTNGRGFALRPPHSR